ncbi:RICIN domain-containing protein [Aliikangiella sp. IMCC44653]
MKGSALLGFLLLTFPFVAKAGYPLAEIKNNTEYTVKGVVHYAACSNDKYTVKPKKKWKAKSRGLCLITKITGNLIGKPVTGRAASERRVVTSYTTSGTSYSQFQINAYGDRYRIFSLNEWKKESKTKQDKSPGFRFVNHTPWPVAISLDQVGCLYYGIVPAKFNNKPGVLRRDTGAVWFTIRAHIQPDGVSPQTDFDCIKPVAELIGDIGLSVLSGGSLTATKVSLKQVAKEVIKTSLKKTTKAVFELTAEEIGRYLTDSSSISLHGQYAGYDWPFRCNKMPEYHITGGPVPIVDNSDKAYLKDGKPFKIKKINSCGNDMMRASRKEAQLSVIPISNLSKKENSDKSPPENKSKHFEIINWKNNLCLDVVGRAGNSRDNVILYRCNGYSDQKWRTVKKGAWFELRNEASGMCLDVLGYDGKSGRNVMLYRCDGHDDQLWSFDVNGKIRNKKNNLCLDVKGYNGKSGDNVMLYRCDGHPDQSWDTKYR